MKTIGLWSYTTALNNCHEPLPTGPARAEQAYQHHLQTSSCFRQNRQRAAI
jgi:hypothetical protein